MNNTANTQALDITAETAEVSNDGRGRPRMTDPTDPQQILAVTRRASAHYVQTASGEFWEVTRKQAELKAKQFRELGAPVAARCQSAGNSQRAELETQLEKAKENGDMDALIRIAQELGALSNDEGEFLLIFE